MDLRKLASMIPSSVLTAAGIDIEELLNHPGSNTVHVANGYHGDVQVTCQSDGTNQRAKAVVSRGTVIRHDTEGVTDSRTVQVTVTIPGQGDVSKKVLSNRSVIVTADGRLVRAEYNNSLPLKYPIASHIHAMASAISGFVKDLMCGICSSSNTVHVANGYHQNVTVSCHTEGMNLRSEAVVSRGEYTKHDSPDWTDSHTVRVTVLIPGQDEPVSTCVKSNRSVIVTANGDLRRAKYTVGPFGKSYVWRDESGKEHLPAS